MKRPATIPSDLLVAILLCTLISCHSPIYKIDCTRSDLSSIKKLLDVQMVLVAGGSFNMGTDSLRDTERPVHQVSVDSFYISRYETTISLFSRFICSTGYMTDAQRDGKGSVIFVKGGFDLAKNVTWTYDEEGMPRSIGDTSYPVLHVSWYDADTFCKWLSHATGEHYRLPSEAEWEYAARGGRNTKGYIYSGGDDADRVAWYGPDAHMHVHPVGLMLPNELGLYDMSGNAWEWCSDLYARYDTPAHHGEERISRGGCYLSGISDTLNSKNECQVAFRGKDDPGVRACDGSFRIVRDLHNAQ